MTILNPSLRAPRRVGVKSSFQPNLYYYYYYYYYYYDDDYSRYYYY